MKKKIYLSSYSLYNTFILSLSSRNVINSAPGEIFFFIFFQTTLVHFLQISSVVKTKHLHKPFYQNKNRSEHSAPCASGFKFTHLTLRHSCSLTLLVCIFCLHEQTQLDIICITIKMYLMLLFFLIILPKEGMDNVNRTDPITEHVELNVKKTPNSH